MLLGPGPPPASADGGCRAVERVAKDVGQARLDAVRPRTKGNGVLRLYLPSRRSRASQWRIASDAPASAWQALLPIATTPPLSRTVVMGGAPMWGSSRAQKAAIGDDHGRPSGRPPSRRGPCRISPGDIALGSPRQSRRQLPALGCSGSHRGEENDGLQSDRPFGSGMLPRPRPPTRFCVQGGKRPHWWEQAQGLNSPEGEPLSSDRLRRRPYRGTQVCSC
jgi:hypothetical protein